MSYTKLNPRNGETQVNDTTMKHLDDGIYNIDQNKIDKSTIELLTVDSTAPEECEEGDLYYNTTTNLIYTATATDTWSETGELPTSKYLYVDLSNSKLYYYDGNNFTSYGGGSSNDVVISPDQPTGDDWKLWIDSDEVGSQASEITNSYSESTGLGYSANYVNNLHTYSTNEIRIGTWIDGKPLYRKVVTYTNQSSWGATNTKTTVKVAHGIVNKDIVVRCSMTNSRNQQFPWVDGTENNVTSWTGIVNIDATDINIYIINDSWASRTWYFTLEYTKTTD